MICTMKSKKRGGELVKITTVMDNKAWRAEISDSGTWPVISG